MPTTLTKRKSNRHARVLQDGMVLLHDYLRDISNWAEGVKDRLKRVYLLVADNGIIQVYAVQSQDRYDFDLCRKLSDFTLAQFDAGVRSSGHIIPDGPDEELSAFFNPAQALLIHVV